jgi:citrate synthase
MQTSGAGSEAWRSAITGFDRQRIFTKGVPIEELMRSGNFGDVVFLLFKGRPPQAWESRLFNAVMIASADHGPTSPSTLAARVIASGNRRALEAAIAGGLLAIGDAHGGAGEETMQVLHEGLKQIARTGATPAAVARDIVQRYVAENRRLPGLGHRFHDVDPRAPVIWGMVRDERLPAGPVELILALEEQLRIEKGRLLPVNVDGAIATALVCLGFEPEIGRIAFVLGRCAGIAAHALEELTREKPMRIKFTYTYDGPQPDEKSSP